MLRTIKLVNGDNIYIFEAEKISIISSEEAHVPPMENNNKVIVFKTASQEVKFRAENDKKTQKIFDDISADIDAYVIKRQ